MRTQLHFTSRVGMAAILMRSVHALRQGAVLALIGLGFAVSGCAFAQSTDATQAVSCVGKSCIQIAVNTGSAVQYFYTAAPGTITVERAMQQALTTAGGNLSYTATYFSNPAGYAAMIISGTPTSTTGSFGTTYWALCVNGKLADLGMSAQAVKNGDKVLWIYTSSYTPNCS